ALDMPGWVVVGEGVQASIGQRLTERTMLTAREREVVGLVTEGLTNLQIAQRLFVSERTVETHVCAILRKLGFRSRTGVAAWHARLPQEPQPGQLEGDGASAT
nr:response regulator transcription factor [Actinomycetota bacterium]